ncbi:type II CAAX endopeptidase family protein [Mucilaginibacter sp.]|uniref:CPBP family intramembrane glutamic endopeptidase n=1 Tax=Mucilaginibacter sp. TaxID=1882438 RepID=UPI0032645C85
MLTEEIPVDAIEKKTCIQCEVIIDAACKYCNSCGARQSPAVEPERVDRWSLLQQAAIFFVLFLLVCCASKFIDDLQSFGWLLFFEVCIASLAVAFFAMDWQENKRLLQWPNFTISKLSLYCGIAMLGAFLVHYSVGWLNVTIFSREEELYSEFSGSYYADFLLIFFMAVTPALFEELGFRGYLLNVLLKVADKGQAIYISAFLFSIIHLSFISLFWLIPFALLIGHIRVKENTIWYSIFFHFCFNLTSCLFQIL